MSGVSLEEALAFGRGTERSFMCPDHQASHETASVNTIKGVWYCYSCGAHGAVDPSYAPTVKEALAALTADTPERVYPEEWLDLYDAEHISPYWGRRFGWDVARQNRCGTDPYYGAPTYPIRSNSGAVLGVVTRHEHTNPKYKYPYNVATSRLLYRSSYDPWASIDVIVLVEGAGDVMAHQQDGVPDTWLIAGCYGASVHHPQLEVIATLNPKVILSAFDDDDAGHKAYARSRDALADVAPVLSHPWIRFGGKDAGEVPAGSRIAALATTLTEGGYGHLT